MWYLLKPFPEVAKADLSKGISSLVLLVILSLSFVQRSLYEWFLGSHLLLTTAGLAATWFHLPVGASDAKILLLIGACLWVGIAVLHVLYLAFRNVTLGRAFTTARITGRSGAVQVTIKAPRPWDVRAGEWIFLTIPAAGLTSAFQGHPFMIVWWERSGDGLMISLLVKPRRGFTRSLAGLTNRDLFAFIDGPYGPGPSLGEYGTVLMFATGIGIAGHVPYMKDLVRGYNSCEVRTRRIALIWHLDDEGEGPPRQM